MTTVVLATDSAELAEHLLHATGGGLVALPLEPLPSDPAELFTRLPGGPIPDVLVLGVGSGATGTGPRTDAGTDAGTDAHPSTGAGTAVDAVLRLASRVSQDFPQVGVVVVSEHESEIALAALRAGVLDVLHPAADPQVVRGVLEHAVAAVRSRTRAAATAGGPGDGSVTGVGGSGGGGVGGRVIGVVSPKGGVGKTTVATNLAVGLAMAEAHSTVLVDLDLQFGDVASALDLDPEFALPDTVHGPAGRDTMVLKTFLTLHGTGLYVICGAHSPVAADGISGEDVGRLLAMLASEFRFVVVDTAPGLSEHTLAAMDAATDLVLVTGMDVPGVRGLRKELDTLTDLGMLTAGRQVVLNLVDAGSGLTVKDVESTIATTVDVVLPRSPAVAASVNQGVPLLQSGVRGPVTDELRRLVGTYQPAAAPAGRARRGRPRGRHRDDRGDRR